MTKLEKIGESIAELADDEFWKLSELVKEMEADRWDRQIEADAKAGKLDKLFEAAKAEIAAGNVKPLCT